MVSTYQSKNDDPPFSKRKIIQLWKYEHSSSTLASLFHPKFVRQSLLSAMCRQARHNVRQGYSFARGDAMAAEFLF